MTPAARPFSGLLLSGDSQESKVLTSVELQGPGRHADTEAARSGRTPTEAVGCARAGTKGCVVSQTWLYTHAGLSKLSIRRCIRLFYLRLKTVAI